MNSQHRNIKFTVEKEKDSTLSFLDVNASKVNDSFETSVFRKKTFTGLGMNYESAVDNSYKRNLIGCLVMRAYRICSNYFDFTKELDLLKKYFLANGFPLKFIERNIREKLNQIFIKNDPITSVSPKLFYLKIPYYSSYSYKMKRNLVQLFKKYYPQIHLRVILTNTNTIGSMFKFKDQLHANLCSEIVYKYSCGDCDATYVGKSQRHLKTRISEHKGVSVRTGQHLTKPAFSNIRNHAWEKDHRILEDNFKVICKTSSNTDLLILENLTIHQHKPSLNDYTGLRSLVLF